MTEFLKLAFPVVLTYLGITVMGFIDLLFVGHINSAAIGAVGIGTSLFSWFLVFILGLSSGLEYLVSHAHGAKENVKQCQYLIQGILLILGVSIILTGILVGISMNLEWIGINADVLAPAKSYSIVLALSLPAAAIYNVLRIYLTAMGIARPAMVILLVGNLINAGLGYVLILGHWGSPALGALGAAWATLIARVLTMIAQGIYLQKWNQKNGQLLSSLPYRVDFKVMMELVRVGMPTALQMIFEVGVFTVATTLAAKLSIDELAAHQIVLNTASLTFMVPFGVGSATAVLVGQSLGRKDREGAIRSARRGFTLGVGFMVISCIGFLSFSDLILGFFTQDVHVIAVGKSVLFIAALFQLSDGTQTVGTGALRGMGDTQGPMFFNLCGHWLIGLPVGTLLCFHYGWGLRGLWVGLSLGLTCVAVAIFIRWWVRSKKLMMATAI